MKNYDSGFYYIPYDKIRINPFIIGSYIYFFFKNPDFDR